MANHQREQVLMRIRAEVVDLLRGEGDGGLTFHEVLRTLELVFSDLAEEQDDPDSALNFGSNAFSIFSDLRLRLADEAERLMEEQTTDRLIEAAGKVAHGLWDSTALPTPGELDQLVEEVHAIKRFAKLPEHRVRSAVIRAVGQAVLDPPSGRPRKGGRRKKA